ncbi:hypothetical protein HK44_020365 [Pseudomonas fluorescens HK44]|uniref:Uncharacterized protein n=1 Tax=Pseudomonas fluorescens HK44 TaxID=1042209 RepID=A0A010S5A7_PSEFL|nr:hypothetical protein [Pseudomonas fluorescens]EXF95764.1 hypothetical protein HK44_020365 [Pseudomonas fluorescens HK44]
MNEIIQMPARETSGLTAAEAHRFSAVEIRQRVNLVQEVMRDIMKRETHYGTIPGTNKPTLYKPGAEVLCVTFRVAQEYKIEDLSVQGEARYRVTCMGRHQTTGVALGEGVGECSSNEEKYKWRAVICKAELNATPENLRRKKYYKNGNTADQVRTEAADLANTILKMACKRAMIAMTLNVTAASDIFTQDIEDLPEELRPQEGTQTTNQKPGPAPHDPELAAHWIAQANAAATPEALTEVWKAGVSAINEVKDMTSYDAFKTAVGARGVVLKASAPKAESEPEQSDADDEVEFEEIPQ